MTDLNVILPQAQSEPDGYAHIARVAVALANNEQMQAVPAKKLTTVVDDATRILNDAVAINEQAYDRFRHKSDGVSALAKTVSQATRKAANDMAEGLQRIERLANFDALERRAALIERLANAMQVLADIEKSGKLEKIINAIK